MSTATTTQTLQHYTSAELHMPGAVSGTSGTYTEISLDPLKIEKVLERLPENRAERNQIGVGFPFSNLRRIYKCCARER